MSAASDPAPFALRLPPSLAEDAHKGDAGCVLAIAGSRRMPGAAVLVARAAQRAGAGLVVACALDPELLTVVPAAAPEAVMAELTLPSDPSSGDMDTILAARAPHAWLFGPGVGNDARARAWLSYLLGSEAKRPLVLDADALNALDGAPERLRDYHGPLVLTPHPGEAGRLLQRKIPADKSGRLECARELAERSGAVVCLKGSGTVVAHGDEAYVNGTGNPGMATAGAGDVLAGILVALLAAFRNEPEVARDAALFAVHLHGLAGDLAARELGQRALIASDLVRAIPAAWRELEDDA